MNEFLENNNKSFHTQGINFYEHKIVLFETGNAKLRHVRVCGVCVCVWCLCLCVCGVCVRVCVCVVCVCGVCVRVCVWRVLCVCVHVWCVCVCVCVLCVCVVFVCVCVCVCHLEMGRPTPQLCCFVTV